LLSPDEVCRRTILCLTGDKKLKLEKKADQAVGRVKQKVKKVVDKVKDALC